MGITVSGSYFTDGCCTYSALKEAVLNLGPLSVVTSDAMQWWQNNLRSAKTTWVFLSSSWVIIPLILTFCDGLSQNISSSNSDMVYWPSIACLAELWIVPRIRTAWLLQRTILSGLLSINSTVFGTLLASPWNQLEVWGLYTPGDLKWNTVCSPVFFLARSL